MSSDEGLEQLNQFQMYGSGDATSVESNPNLVATLGSSIHLDIKWAGKVYAGTGKWGFLERWSRIRQSLKSATNAAMIEYFAPSSVKVSFKPLWNTLMSLCQLAL